MLRFLPGFLKGPISFVLFCVNTVFWCLVLYIFTFFKVLLPDGPLRRKCSKRLTDVAESWNLGNELITNQTQTIHWDIKISPKLERSASYLIIANHLSWIDIVVLERVFNRKVPFLRFFIKKQLFWVPFLGPAWWALDFPFMSRHSSEYLRRHPEKRGEDLKTARKRCERFKEAPTSILIFAEGTRFREEKRKKLASPFKHLLPPKAGGVATVMDVMGEQFKEILDVTIHYPDNPKSFWDLFSGKISRVVVRVDSHPIPQTFLPKPTYASEQKYQNIKSWLRDLWAAKDRLLGNLWAKA